MWYTILVNRAASGRITRGLEVYEDTPQYVFSLLIAQHRQLPTSTCTLTHEKTAPPTSVHHCSLAARMQPAYSSEHTPATSAAYYASQPPATPGWQLHHFPKGVQGEGGSRGARSTADSIATHQAAAGKAAPHSQRQEEHLRGNSSQGCCYSPYTETRCQLQTAAGLGSTSSAQDDDQRVESNAQSSSAEGTPKLMEPAEELSADRPLAEKETEASSRWKTRGTQLGHPVQVAARREKATRVSHTGGTSVGRAYAGNNTKVLLTDPVLQLAAQSQAARSQRQPRKGMPRSWPPSLSQD